MTTKEWIDISQVLRAETPVWPGDREFRSGWTFEMSASAPVNVGWFEMSGHCGTHADAPMHYDHDGGSADALALSTYIGRARVVDLRGVGPLVTPEMLAPALAVPVRRLLIRTYECFPAIAWQEQFTAISPDAVALAAAHGVVLIGVDSPSLDPQDSKTMSAHLAVKAAAMGILEGLVLDGVESGDYELIALPLRLQGLDASPVRAVLRAIS